LVFQKFNISNLPLLFPIRVVVPAGTTRIISFPNEFLGRAVALLIQIMMPQIMQAINMVVTH